MFSDAVIPSDVAVSPATTGSCRSMLRSHTPATVRSTSSTRPVARSPTSTSSSHAVTCASHSTG